MSEAFSNLYKPYDRAEEKYAKAILEICRLNPEVESLPKRKLRYLVSGMQDTGILFFEPMPTHSQSIQVFTNKMIPFANDYVEDKTDSAHQIKGLFLWVNEVFEDRLHRRENNLAWLWEHKAGRCSEKSTMMVALLKAIGIPARKVGSLTVYKTCPGQFVELDEGSSFLLSVDGQPTREEQGDYKVTVKLKANQKVSGIGLDEDLKNPPGTKLPADWADWNVTTVQNDGATYNPDKVQWLWREIPAGETRNLMYKATAPANPTEGTYKISGTASGNSPQFSREVGGDTDFKYSPCRSIPYVVSHWQDGKLNPNDDPTIEMREILDAINWWSNDNPVPKTGGKTMDMDMILTLIRYWAEGNEVTNNTETTNLPQSTQGEASTPLQPLSFQLDTRKVASTAQPTAKIKLTTARGVNGLLLDLDLPEGWNLDLPADQKNVPGHRRSTDQLLWLKAKANETKELSATLLLPPETKPGNYRITGNIESKSPHFTRGLKVTPLVVTAPKDLNLTGTTVTPNPVTTKDTVSFNVEGSGIVSTEVEVYGASGTSVFNATVKGSRTITWNLIDRKGEPISNGLYLYRVRAYGAEGDSVSSVVNRVVVLR